MATILILGRNFWQVEGFLSYLACRRWNAIGLVLSNESSHVQHEAISFISSPDEYGRIIAGLRADIIAVVDDLGLFKHVDQQQFPEVPGINCFVRCLRGDTYLYNTILCQSSFDAHAPKIRSLPFAA